MTGFGQARDRAERLLTLSCALQLGRAITLQDLRGRFGLYADAGEETARRQFERDKEDLRALGVEVETRQLAGEHAYLVPTRPPTVAVRWTDAQAVALAMLSAMVGDEVTGGALAKTTAATGGFPAEKVAARIQVALGPHPALSDALARRRTVRFPYRDAQGRESERTIEVWALASRRGLRYVTGFDRDRQEARAFRLDRFRGPVMDVGAATHERPMEGLGVPLAPQDRSTVHLRVAADRLADALAMNARVEATTAEHLEVTLADVRDEVAIAWALRHDAAVLSPRTIADEVAIRRQRLIERHRGEPSLEPFATDGPIRRPRRAGLSDIRLTRLLALPEWLEERPGITVEEIATAFGCDAAEVEAELDLLDWLEVPTFGPLGDLDRYADGQLEFTARLSAPRADLTAVEAVHLLTMVETARALLSDADGSALAEVADRLRDVLPGGVSAQHLADLDHPALAVLREAVGMAGAVRFTYRGRHDGQFVPRRLWPTQLQLVGGVLYVVGTDPERDGVRTFRVDRMDDVLLETGATGIAASPPVVPRYVAVDDEERIELRLSPRAVWILTLVEASQQAERADGDVHAVVHTDVPEWVLAHVRAAGGEAELLRPAHLRHRLAVA